MTREAAANGAAPPTTMTVIDVDDLAWDADLPAPITAFLASASVTEFLDALLPLFPSHSMQSLREFFSRFLLARHRHGFASDSQLDWSNKYVPSRIEDLFAQNKIVEQIRSWMNHWLSPPSSSATTRSLLLVGPSSSSKSSIAAAIAGSSNSRVIEIHAGMRRSGKDILAMCGEATQSHRVGKIEMTGKSERKNASVEDDDMIVVDDSRKMRSSQRRHRSPESDDEEDRPFASLADDERESEEESKSSKSSSKKGKKEPAKGNIATFFHALPQSKSSLKSKPANPASSPVKLPPMPVVEEPKRSKAAMKRKSAPVTFEKDNSAASSTTNTSVTTEKTAKKSKQPTLIDLCGDGKQAVTIKNKFLKQPLSMDEIDFDTIDLTSPPQSTTLAPPPPEPKTEEVETSVAKRFDRTLTLFEDIDIVFDSDTRFHSTLKSLLHTAKVPLVLTAATVPQAFADLDDTVLTVICCDRHPIEVTALASILISATETGLSQQYDSRTINAGWSCDEIVRFAAFSGGDLRSMLLQLQLRCNTLSLDVVLASGAEPVTQSLLPSAQSSLTLSASSSLMAAEQLGLTDHYHTLSSMTATNEFLHSLSCCYDNNVDYLYLNVWQHTRRMLESARSRLCFTEIVPPLPVEQLITLEQIPLASITVQAKSVDAQSQPPLRQSSAASRSLSPPSPLSPTVANNLRSSPQSSPIPMSDSDSEDRLAPRRRGANTNKRKPIILSDSETENASPLKSLIVPSAVTINTLPQDSDGVIDEEAMQRQRSEAAMMVLRERIRSQLLEFELQQRRAFREASRHSLSQSQRASIAVCDAMATMADCLSLTDIVSQPRVMLVRNQRAIPASLFYHSHRSLPPFYTDSTEPFGPRSYRSMEWWLTSEEIDSRYNDEIQLVESVFHDMAATVQSLTYQSIQITLSATIESLRAITVSEATKRDDNQLPPKPRKTRVDGVAQNIVAILPPSLPSASMIDLQDANAAELVFPSKLFSFDILTPAVPMAPPLPASLKKKRTPSPSPFSATSVDRLPYKLRLQPVIENQFDRVQRTLDATIDDPITKDFRPRVQHRVNHRSPTALKSCSELHSWLYSALKIKLRSPSSRVFLMDYLPYIHQIAASERAKSSETRALAVKEREKAIAASSIPAELLEDLTCVSSDGDDVGESDSDFEPAPRRSTRRSSRRHRDNQPLRSIRALWARAGIDLVSEDRWVADGLDDEEARTLMRRIEHDAAFRWPDGFN